MASRILSYPFEDMKSNPQKNGSTSTKPSYAYASSRRRDYTSDGVSDNDIFKLPASDWQLLALLTAVGALIRLFKIYQPSSVVFDEVQ